MAFGPFDSYAPPGVYTKTQTQQGSSGPPTGNRIPVLIGVGRETLSQDDFELVRGSSASVDQRIVNEDVNDRFILDNANPDNPVLGAKTGSEVKFRVQNYPIVSGNGQGLVTSDTSDITVTVDGDLVSPAAVDGARGVITLQVPPQTGEDVRVTYFFNRTDTKFTDDLSGQVAEESAILLSSQVEDYEILSGANVLNLNVDGADASVTLTTGATQSANNVVNDINAAGIVGLTASVAADNEGNNRIQLEAQGSIEILSGTANSVLGFGAGQKTTRNRTFYVYQAPIVTGDNGGIITTDPSDVVVKVDGNQVVPEEVDGTNGAVTLKQAPIVGAVVSVEYFHNTWQDTFDYLPNTGIRKVQQVGISPGRTDYIEGNDYVVDENGRLLWGSAATIESGLHTAGTEFFDETQISASLVDNRMYFEETSRFVDRSVSPAVTSDTTVLLGNVPTTGNGRSTSLDSKLFGNVSNSRVGVSTHRADLVKVYHGDNLSEAMANGPVGVVDVDPETRKVTVEDAIPPSHTVWATYWYNQLQDDELTFEVLSQSTATTPGQYSVYSSRRDEQLFEVDFGTTGVNETIQWPSGVETNPDAFIAGADGVNETVTVTFKEIGAEPAVFTNYAADPYSLYADASDTLYVDVDGNSLTVDLNQSAFGVTVSDGHDDGSTYDIVATENDVFEFEVDGTDYSVTLTAGLGRTGADIAEDIWRSVPTDATITGTSTESFAFTDASDDLFDFDMNGTPVNVDFGTLTGQTAAQLATLINTEITNANLTVGDPAVVGNDGHAVDDGSGKVQLLASESLTIGTGTANPVLGFTNGDSHENILVASYRDSGADDERFLLRSKVSPSGPADASHIRVQDGNANGTLGFTDFQYAEGTEKAVNKGATLLSGAISASDLASLNSASTADFVVAVNGTEHTLDLSSLASVSAIQTALDAALTDATVAVEDTDKIRITSNLDTNQSRIEVRAGTANQYVGFSEGDSASQRRVEAHEIAAVLNSQASDWYSPTAATEYIASAFADTFVKPGEGTYLRLTTFAEGSTASFTFGTGTDSALNDTGIGIEAGDSVAGTGARDGFDVASSATNGSTGEGVVGQTYQDSNTGLRFTILEAGTGDYTDGQSFTLNVSETFTTGFSKVVKAVPGTEVRVDNTTDIGVGDTAVVTTYNKSGAEPGIGDFYYISYEYEKTDFSTRLFTRFRDIQRNYGKLSAENPLTLASYLAVLNGAVIVGCKQVLKTPGFSQAPTAAFMDALEELKKPLASGITPDLLVPLTTDPDVMGAYVNHSEIQSSQRFRQERRCIFGVASGTRPEDAANIAKSLKSERSILVYPDSAIVTLTNELGEDESFIVDGTYVAAALAGVLVSPQFDVATPLTRRRLVGFRRLNRSLDEIEKNQLAVGGVTVLEDLGSFLQVRDGLTTDVTNRFTSTPSIVAIKDHVQKQARKSLDRFIGLKFLTSRAQDVELALSGLLNTLMEQQIIVDFKGVRAEPDPNDPTVLRVSAFYAPIFPLKYIPITYTIGSANSL